MWRYINNPNIITQPVNQHIVECDYNSYNGTTNDYGSAPNIVNIPNIGLCT